MFEISIESNFSAAHALEGYPGECARTHGHNYQVRMGVRARELDSIGLAVDFRRAKNCLAEVLSLLDHRHLNQIEPFSGKDGSLNPSCENIAKYVFHAAEERLTDEPVELSYITIFETPGCSVTYTPDG